MDHLVEHLRDASLLLVLDNLEQISDVGTDVSALLAAAPGVKILATSRASLGIVGEREFPVPPMEVPGAGRAVEGRHPDGIEHGRLPISTWNGFGRRLNLFQ